jgi:hypothetical protein
MPSRDLGYTLGCYEITRTGQRVVGTGKYVTIWKKQSDRSWKVVLRRGGHPCAQRTKNTSSAASPAQ